MDLLVHRRDVFAEQHANGSYTPVRRELTYDDVQEHLAGFASYGTYVIDPPQRGPLAPQDDDIPGNTVKYIVFDLDIMDEKAAITLCNLVEEMVLLGWVRELDHERPPHDCLLREFSGNKGTHVWLFFDEPVPAEKVRRWVSADFMPQWQEAASENGWPTALEVFPKQDTVPEGGFGNLVKLPLGVHQVSGARSEIVPFQDWPTCVEEVVPLPAVLVPERDAVGPARPARRGERQRSDGTGPASPFPCIDTIANEGVGQGVRDKAMFHLALYYYGHGIPDDVALELCERANENFDPPLTDAEVQQKVRSAYRGTYESARCGDPWLLDICPGPCRTGWHVRESTSVGGELHSAQPGETVDVDVLAVRADGGVKRLTVGHKDADNTPTFVVRSAT